MSQGINTRRGYDALEQQAALHGRGNLSGRPAFIKEKPKKTRSEEKSGKEAEQIGKERARAGTEKIKAETEMIKAGTKAGRKTKSKSGGRILKNGEEVESDLDKAKTADYQSKAYLNQMKAKKVQRETEEVGNAKELNKLQEANLNLKELEIAKNKRNVAVGFLSSVDKVSYASYRQDMLEKGWLPERDLPTNEEFQTYSTVDINKWKSNLKNVELSLKDVVNQKKLQLSHKKFALSESKRKDRLNENILKRLNKKSQGNIASLSSGEQQQYYEAASKLDNNNSVLGRKIFLTPDLQDQYRAQTGNENLTVKEMQKMVNRKNAANKRVDDYALKNNANDEIVAQYVERDGRSETEVRRALARNGINFEKRRGYFVRKMMREDSRTMPIPEARKKAFSSYLEQLNRLRGM